MVNWRETILRNFKPKISRLTLVADPDGLLTEEGMLLAIKERGFDLISFDDPIAFRYAYESQYRSLWDKGHKTDLVVVLRSSEQQLSKLPFDLLKAGRTLTFALHQLFPKLNYPVIEKLERVYLDSIDKAYQRYDGDHLTERGTKEFVLKNCFKIVPDILGTPIELMKLLLSLHSRKVELPDILSEFLLESLENNRSFEKWQLADILKSREKFLRFLQHEWTIFLDTLQGLSLECLVPFGHEDVRAYIDTFFLDGSLTPVKSEYSSNLPTWAQTGVVHDSQADGIRRYRGLRQRFEEQLPSVTASHRDWQQISQKWAELVVLRWEWDEALESDDKDNWNVLQEKVESTFGEWMFNRYGSLHNLPYHQQPVMVHQIPRFIAVERTRKKLSKIALLVMDGLAFDQWLLLKKNLEEFDKSWRFQESTAFAWIPTLTTVTRQSIFAGEPPFYFPDSLNTTSKEKIHWLRFWEDQGVRRDSVELITNIKGADDEKLDNALGDTRISILGIVWNKVDDIADTMQLKTAGLHNQVKLWGSQGHLNQLLEKLFNAGFSVYLTADHGNVSATGIGVPKEGIFVETKGRRARVYDRQEFLDEVTSQFPESIPWSNCGLPPGKYVLLAKSLKAFTHIGDEIVAHGGISLEEVLVPFVTVTKEQS